MQPLKEIDDHYKVSDPWGYKTNPDDFLRKQHIVSYCKKYCPGDLFTRALDIGAGEGWITESLPALELWGYEVSDNAASRFPDTVRRANPPKGMFPLVTLCGILYGHYDLETFYGLVKSHASKIVVTCNIKSWEHYGVSSLGHQIDELEFPYREFVQKLRVFVRE